MSALPRRPWHAAAAAALITLVAACGSGTNPAATASGSPTAADSPATAPPGSQLPAPPPGAWLTYGHDAARSGVDPSSPPAHSPRLAWTSPPLDGSLYAQPLVDGRMVLAATEGGSLYGLDAATGAVRWRTHVADPVKRSALPCGDIFPLGITGTPVIDGTTHTAFAVAETGAGEHRLVAVSVEDGTLRWSRVIDAGGTERIAQQERAALTLTHGRVVVAMGGLYGDCGEYKGYVVAVDEDGGGPLRSWVVPTSREAGIWAPPGPAVGPGGDLFVVTGNGAETEGFDHGDSVVRLTPDLQEVGYFAPSNWSQLNAGDLDLGTTGASLVAGGRLLAAGKDGVAYLLHQDRLGGIGGAAAQVSVGAPVFGGIAVSGDVAFVPSRSALVAVRIGSGDSLSVLWRSAETVWTPIVAGGRVWGMTTDGTLVGIDPATGRVLDRVHVGSVEHFVVPSAAGGRLYVGSTPRVVAFAI